MLTVVPSTLKQAQRFILDHHRHNLPPSHGSRFAVGVAANGCLCGVAVVANPVARALQDGFTLEVVRTCTDGTRNANSMLYGAAWRAMRALGFTRGITYTQKSESGASLRAAGWAPVAELKPRGDWARHSVKRPRGLVQQPMFDDPRRQTGDVPRIRWEIRAGETGGVHYVDAPANERAVSRLEDAEGTQASSGQHGNAGVAVLLREQEGKE